MAPSLEYGESKHVTRVALALCKEMAAECRPLQRMQPTSKAIQLRLHQIDKPVIVLVDYHCGWLARGYTGRFCAFM